MFAKTNINDWNANGYINGPTFCFLFIINLSLLQ